MDDEPTFDLISCPAPPDWDETIRTLQRALSREFFVPREMIDPAYRYALEVERLRPLPVMIIRKVLSCDE